MSELHNDIKRFIEHSISEVKKHFKKYENIVFYKVTIPKGSLYIVYEIKIEFIRDNVASYEIKDNGIILERNRDYLYYNFKENYENKEKIIKKFVEEFI